MAYFHRAKAAELLALFDQQFPAVASGGPACARSCCRRLPPTATTRACCAVARSFSATFPDAPSRTQVSLLMAEAYARTDQTAAGVRGLRCVARGTGEARRGRADRRECGPAHAPAYGNRGGYGGNPSGPGAVARIRPRARSLYRAAAGARAASRCACALRARDPAQPRRSGPLRAAGGVSRTERAEPAGRGRLPARYRPLPGRFVARQAGAMVFASAAHAGVREADRAGDPDVLGDRPRGLLPQHRRRCAASARRCFCN